MPSLHLADIPKQASTVPTAIAEEAGVSVLRHELFTNDVLYLEAALDLRPVPPSLLHLVPLFCRYVRRASVGHSRFRRPQDALAPLSISVPMKYCSKPGFLGDI